MKSKRADQRKTKASLQKTSSTFINNHTHRNSIISETLPLFYNESMLSIRASSLHRSKICESNPPQKCTESISEHKFQKKRLMIREISYQNYSKRKENRDQYLKTKRSNISKEKKEGKKMHFGSQKKPTNKKGTTFTESMIKQPIQGKEPVNLNEILKRSKELLDHYRSKTEQLTMDRDRFRSKYREVMLRLKKYQLK